MKKIVTVLLLILSVAMLFDFFWQKSSPDQNLSAELETLLQQGEMKIDLHELIEYDWSTAMAFGPYTSREHISELLNVVFKGNDGGIEVLEDRFLLVIANEKQVLKTVVLNRKYGDYTIRDNRYLIVMK